MASVVGLDRDRAFYPTVMIVVASYYALFGVMGGSGHALAAELAVMALFLAATIAGFKSSLWIVVVALAGHGVLDAIHASLIDDPGVPVWWPAFCGSYDVVAAGCLAWLLWYRRIPARAA
jgi:hypothetical protein